MKKLAVCFSFSVLISLLIFGAFKYFQRVNMPTAMVPTGTLNVPVEPVHASAPKTNPPIKALLETAQSVNVDSYTPEQARLRDFFQSGSTVAARAQAPVSGK